MLRSRNSLTPRISVSLGVGVSVAVSVSVMARTGAWSLQGLAQLVPGNVYSEVFGL